MMVEHSFGGPWTERKLKCLRDYLSAYRTIFTGNPRARYFEDEGNDVHPQVHGG
jgi:hypothetical protein